MNAAVTQTKKRLSLGVSYFLMYALLPLIALCLAGVIVVVQFTNAAGYFAKNSRPMGEQWSLMLPGGASFDADESAALETDEWLLSNVELPASALNCLLSVPEGAHPIVETTIAQGSGLINATDHSADLSAVQATPLGVSEEGPTVLVVHTHTTESFFDPADSPVQTVVLGQEESVFGYYGSENAPRSLDADKNVIAVGRAFCESLEEAGVSTVHCTEICDLDYSNAYASSLSCIEEMLKQYPSIRYVIDLHRDSLVRADSTKLKPTATVDGERVAQVMLVVGAGSETLSQPNWRENFAMSAHYQSYLSEVSEDFARPVYLRYGRFNQHLGAGSMLLEVGSCGNTLAEARRAGALAGEALARMILDAS